MTIRMLLALSVAVLFALPACRGGTRTPASPLARAVLPSVEGFQEVEGPSGPLTSELAEKATTTRPPVLRRYLQRSGYQDGYARVFRREDEFVSVLVYEFFAERNAQGLVDLTIDELSGSAAYQPFTDAAVPQSRGYTLTSDVDGRVRFCVGEWFWLVERAFSVVRCAPFVLSVPAVTGLARQQYDLAVAQSGVGR